MGNGNTRGQQGPINDPRNRGYFSSQERNNTQQQSRYPTQPTVNMLSTNNMTNNEDDPVDNENNYWSWPNLTVPWTGNDDLPPLAEPWWEEFDARWPQTNTQDADETDRDPESNLIATNVQTRPWTIPALINNHPVDFLLDTGAGIDTLDIGTFTAMTQKPRLFPPYHSTVYTVDGSMSNCIGQFDARIEIEGKLFITPLHVMKCADYQGILGRPFMYAHGVQIDAQTETITNSSIPNPRSW